MDLFYEKGRSDVGISGRSLQLVLGILEHTPPKRRLEITKSVKKESDRIGDGDIGNQQNKQDRCYLIVLSN